MEEERIILKKGEQVMMPPSIFVSSARSVDGPVAHETIPISVNGDTLRLLDIAVWHHSRDLGSTLAIEEWAHRLVQDVKDAWD